MSFSKDMMRALAQDGKKLRQLTSEDHGPEFWDICPCCSGFGNHEEAAPQHNDPYFCMQIECIECGGSGYILCEYS
jgi:hypothetical protein